MSIEIRFLASGDVDLLDRAGAGVFGHPIDRRWSTEFLADPRHHLAVAIEAQDAHDAHDLRIVGMASAVHYVHPDKAPELWVNEVGVAPTHRDRGVGRRLVAALLDRARALGCHEAWVLTDEENAAARRMYAAAGGAERSLQLLIAFDLEDDRDA